jgi:AcrR family transcriptional regulator
VTGLRESKKQQTRERIASEAMRLFATRGFDHVTVAEVADAAQVSEKTVFNYFPTKEDIFFDEAPARLAAIDAAVREREPGQSAIAALRELQGRDTKRLTSELFATFARIIEESPALQTKELDLMGHFADTLAETLRTELDISELDARVAANTIVGVQWQFFRDARKQALAGKHGPAAARKLKTDLARAYELLENGLATLEHST